MKNIFIILIWFVCIPYSFSQIKYSGIVNDSINNPLELANVIAIDNATNLLESYSITNEEGYYSLELKQNTSYNFQVSYIGKKSIETLVKTSENDETKNFTLLADNVLDEVEITYEIPVTIKGDTIV